MQILILDGGLGTTLQLPPHNISFTPATPLWSSHLLLSDPATLTSVHAAFVASGADIVLTATYQTSFEGFALTDPTLTPDHAGKYMRGAIPLARDAFNHTGRQVRVALSLGPYGATMSPVSAEYSGVYPVGMDSESALREWHTKRLKVWSEDDGSWDGLEYVAFETVKRVDEVRAIRGTVKDTFSPSTKPWWIVGVFPGEDVNEVEVREWVRAAVVGNDTPRPWGIGVNCSKISNLGAIVAIMQNEIENLSHGGEFVDEWTTQSGKPWLVLYPDGTRGEQYDPVTKEWVKTSDAGAMKPWEEVFADVVGGIKDGEWEGVIAGGCCRTGPKEIAKLRDALQ